MGVCHVAFTPSPVAWFSWVHIPSARGRDTGFSWKITINMVCGCYSVTFLGHTPIMLSGFDVWLGEDQRTNNIKTLVFKEIRLQLQISLTIVLHTP